MYEFRAKQEDVALSVWQRLWQKIMASPAVILLVLAAILCFVANHLLVVTDPVESNYVLTAKEMLASGDYFSPRIFGNYWYDKPIFFYWELIAAFKLFGISNFSARFSRPYSVWPASSWPMASRPASTIRRRDS